MGDLLAGDRHLHTARGPASSSSGRAVFTPSATMRISAMISSRERPRPSCSPTIRFRLSELVHVATRSPTPASPAMVMRSPPMATPRRPSSARPRVMRAASDESPSPRPWRMPAAMARTFLVAPAISHPTTSGLVYTRNVWVRRSSWTERHMSSSVMATTVAAGWPAAISRARFGPVSTPAGWPGTTWAMTSGFMRRWVPPPARGPLASESTGVELGEGRDSSVRTLRNPCDGTAITRRSLPVTPPLRSDAVADEASAGQGDPREVVGILVGSFEALGECGAACPQHRRRRAGRHGSHRRAPRARADDRDLVEHALNPTAWCCRQGGPVHWRRDRSARAPAPPDRLRRARPREGLRRSQGTPRSHPRRRRT